jgi:hypothetical protein
LQRLGCHACNGWKHPVELHGSLPNKVWLRRPTSDADQPQTEFILKRKERTDWFSLYVGRIFWIGPLYLLAVFCALLIVFLKVGFTTNLTAGKLLEEIAPWLALGYLNLTPVNGYSDAPLVLASGAMDASL